MKTAALVQKPYDILNILEYLHGQRLNREQLTVFLIGKHANVIAAEKLCRALKIKFEHLPEPDIYSHWVGKLTSAQFPLGKVLFAFKALLLVPSFFWWYLCWFQALLRWRGLAFDLLLYDPWRSKCVFLSAISARKQVLLDGGRSTVTYNLCDAFAAGGARYLVAASLRAQRTRVPWLIRRDVARRVDEEACFFSCYAARVPASSRFSVLANDYAHSRALAATAEIADYALVLGQPMLLEVDRYVQVARICLQEAGVTMTGESVQYRFHPQDLNLCKLDAGYAQAIERAMAAKSIPSSFPEYGLEFDFLFLKRLPRFIITYESSSTVWLQQVFGARIQLKIL
jgi:hypothetical protein